MGHKWKGTVEARKLRFLELYEDGASYQEIMTQLGLDEHGKLFKSTLNNRLHRNLACVIDKSSRGAKLERAFEELPMILGIGALQFVF